MYQTDKLIPTNNQNKRNVNKIELCSSKCTQTISTYLLSIGFNIESWKQWIPLSQKENYFKEGFYAIEKSDEFKIISINTNVCYGFNFWAMFNENNDPGGQLNWLISELDLAEKKNQNVHIIGHIAAAHRDCSKNWSKNFYKIVSRYRRIIKGQFYGHTHRDEFKIFYGPSDDGIGSGSERQPINALFISPSLTAYKGNNPSYKIFYADPSTGDLLDYETYVLDLDEANRKSENELDWFLLYRATKAYDIPDATPKSLNSLIQKMATNQTLFDSYYQHFLSLPSTNSTTTTNQDKWKSGRLRKKMLCEMVDQYAGRRGKECDHLKLIVDDAVKNTVKD